MDSTVAQIHYSRGLTGREPRLSGMPRRFWLKDTHPFLLCPVCFYIILIDLSKQLFLSLLPSIVQRLIKNESISYQEVMPTFWRTRELSLIRVDNLEGCLYDRATVCSLSSSERGSAARPLFPQLYRARKLNKPLWMAMGRRVSREPGSQET